MCPVQSLSGPREQTEEEETEYKFNPGTGGRVEKWFDLYNEKMFSKGKYRGELYDIGFDRPEAHVVQKGDTLYYSFYAEDFDGQLELRGLVKIRIIS